MPRSDQAFGKVRGVLHRLMLQLLELIGLREFEGDGQRRDGVDVRAALFAGEDGAIEFAADRFVEREQHRAARAAQRLVRGEGDHVRQSQRAGICARDDEAGHVRNIGQQIRAHFIGDGAELLPIGRVRIRGVTRDDHLGLVGQRQFANLVVVQLLGGRIDIVRHDLVVLARSVDGRAVREVAARDERQAHHHVAGFDQRFVHGVVGGRARQRLHVDEDARRADGGRGKAFGAAAAGQRFDDVGIFHALVIARIAIAAIVAELLVVVEDLLLGLRARARIGIAFGVQVVQRRHQRFAHGFGHGRFAGDQESACESGGRSRD